MNFVNGMYSNEHRNVYNLAETRKIMVSRKEAFESRVFAEPVGWNRVGYSSNVYTPNCPSGYFAVSSWYTKTWSRHTQPGSEEWSFVNNGLHCMDQKYQLAIGNARKYGV